MFVMHKTVLVFSLQMAEKNSELAKLFLHEKPALLLVKIKQGDGKKYASFLAKEVDCTYSHCVRLLQQMEKLGLVKFDKIGRIKVVKLTKLGEDIAFALENLLRVLQK